MTIITEEEKGMARKYHSLGWNKYQITQKIVQKRGDDIYHDMYNAVSWAVADVKGD